MLSAAIMDEISNAASHQLVTSYSPVMTINIHQPNPTFNGSKLAMSARRSSGADPASQGRGGETNIHPRSILFAGYSSGRIPVEGYQWNISGYLQHSSTNGLIQWIDADLDLILQ